MPSKFVDFPFAPRKFPFFYGWLILGVATFGTLSSMPGQTMGVSVFTDHLLAALGLTRVQLSTAYMVGTICSALLLTTAGRLLDRIGVRAMVVIASLALAASLIVLSYSGEIHRALLRVTNGRMSTPLAFSVILTCFFLIRFFGQGLLTMTSRVMVGKWFQTRLGLANGFMGVFISFGFGSAPLVLSKLVNAFSWQGAYHVLALWLACGMAVIGFTFYRERPEDVGLLKDAGKRRRDSGGKILEVATIRSFTLKEARQTPAFWILNFAMSTQGLAVTAITFHITSIAREAGLNEGQGLSIFLPIACVGVLSNLSGGWMSDKIKLKYLLMTMMAFQATATFGLLFIGDFWGRCLMILGFGVSGGLFSVFIGVPWPRFFGLANLGAIAGMNAAAMSFASALGPFLFGWSFERSGSYTIGAIICLSLPLIALIVSPWANDPQEKFANDHA